MVNYLFLCDSIEVVCSSNLTNYIKNIKNCQRNILLHGEKTLMMLNYDFTQIVQLWIKREGENMGH